MRVRLISGEFGGQFIDTPKRSTTHVMGERVRAAIFNMLQDQLAGAEVLDVFAGSGALGLEALSRGAKRVTFVEKDRVATKIISENCQKLGVQDRSNVINTTVNNWLETKQPSQYDLIFIDPPYDKPQFSTVKKVMDLLKVGGFVVLSHSGRGGVPSKTRFVVVANRSYGNAHITLYRREG